MNIQLMINELNKNGLSDNEIARRTKLGQATITRIRNGQSGGRLKTANTIQQLYYQITAETPQEGTA